MYIIDNHLHLNPFKGKFLNAVDDFIKAGGNGLFVTTMHYDKIPFSVEDYDREFKITIEIANRIKKDKGIMAYAVIGPYPVDIIHLQEKFGINKAIDVMKKAADIAGKMISNGDAIAMGEIGWPHFEISDEIYNASMDILEYCFRICKETNSPSIIHGPHFTQEHYKMLFELYKKVGMKDNKVVKHFANPMPKERYNIVPSFIAKKEIIEDIVNENTPFFLETDYMDDPLHPGAVLNITTVPKRVKSILDKKLINEDTYTKIVLDSYRIVYCIEL
jgi:TatD-related deoxyribonuclease